MVRVLAGLLLVVAAVPAQDGPKFPPPKTLGPVETYGRNIGRAMHLIASSTPDRRNTVRVLFYGQSITEQDWTRQVAADLRKRFPAANLVVENRAIGGFAAQLLVKTAEADLYPFYPDLLIFHVYGSHVEYENIIRRVRERTTADILQQTDHFNATDPPDEETDPAKLTTKQWNPWMNHVFLPGVAKKYGTELADQRGLWRRYLKDHELKPQALLTDNVHLNAHGNYLMAEIVKAHLRPDPKADPAAWADRVKTFEVGKDVAWAGGKLVVPFEGNRVDLVCKPGGGKPAAVRIDGKKPSEFPELVAVTHTTAYPGSKWPCLLKVGAEKPRVVEKWEVTIGEISPDLKQFTFTVAGSVTGPDGAGEGGKRFVSNSGRVVIEPDDWNFEYALRVFKKPVAAPFVVRWEVVPLHADEFRPPAVTDAAVEPVVTAAQGLPNGKHTLELTGGPDVPVAAVRIYRPTPAGK